MSDKQALAIAAIFQELIDLEELIHGTPSRSIRYTSQYPEIIQKILRKSNYLVKKTDDCLEIRWRRVHLPSNNLNSVMDDIESMI